MELDPVMQLDLLDAMRSMFREARLARAGAWCSLACIPGAGYLAGAALFGYPVAATPLVVFGILLPFGLGALSASSLIAVAAFRSAIALDRSGTPELPQPLVGGCLRRHPRVGLAVAVGAVFLAVVALRSARVTHFPPPAHAPASAWLSPATDPVIAAMLVLDARRRMPAGDGRSKVCWPQQSRAAPSAGALAWPPLGCSSLCLRYGR